MCQLNTEEQREEVSVETTPSISTPIFNNRRAARSRKYSNLLAAERDLIMKASIQCPMVTESFPVQVICGGGESFHLSSIDTPVKKR
jgi:hypothetical protein